MINKSIHYIWLGKKEMPKSYKISRESLKKFAKDFEVKVWTENELSKFDLPIYFYKLMNEKKFALASDIYRMHILNKYGGIYFDTDQILINSIDDLLENKMFISRYHEVSDYYGFGLLGVVPKHIFLEKMIDYYNNIDTDKYIIINKIGSEIINYMLHVKDGIENKKEVKINNEIKILDQEYFYPLTENDYRKNTRSYHMANTSWIPWYRKALYNMPFYTQIKNFIKSILPNSLKKKIFKIEYL